MEAEAVAPPAEVEEAVPIEEGVPSAAQVPLTSIPIVASGAGANTPIKIILKDADISIGKMIVKRKEKTK